MSSAEQQQPSPEPGASAAEATAVGEAAVPDAVPPGRPTAVADERERRLDPRTLTAERLAGAVTTAVLSLFLFVAAVTFAVAGPEIPGGWLLPLFGWASATAMLGLFSLVWPALSYRHTSYRVGPHGIRIRRGVLWRSIVSVPRSRVQHTDVSQGPVERLFGLATLVIYTAGTQHASVSLAGLAHDTALAIRDHLILGGEDDAV